jgi:hypothetical protein
MSKAMLKEGDKVALRRSDTGDVVYISIPGTRYILLAREADFRKICTNEQTCITFEVVDRDTVFREVNLRIGG